MSNINEPATTVGFLYPQKIDFNEKIFTLCLDVDKQPLTSSISKLSDLASASFFTEKPEMHITIIGFKYGQIINKHINTLNSDQQEVFLSNLKKLIDTTNWDFVIDSRQFHITKTYHPKDRRESFIQMIILPNLCQFYTKLNTLLNTNLEVPPTHITLFTGGNDPEKAKMGIGINSQSEFLQLNPQLI